MQRFNSIFQNQLPDRQMFTLTLSMYGAKLADYPLAEYYSNSEFYANGQQKVVELIKPDVLFSPFSLPLEAQAFGSQLIFMKKNPPNIKKPVLEKVSDIDHFTIPDLSQSRVHQYFLQSISRLADLYKNAIPIAAPTCPPIDFPLLLMGIENWLDTYLFHPKQAKKLINILTDYFVEWTNLIFDAGADFLVLPSVFCNPDFLTKKLIKEEMLDLYHSAFSKVNGPIVLHHGGAKITPFMQYFKDFPNVAAYQIDHRDSFSAAREKIGNDYFLIGNLDGPNLWRFSPDQMKQVCHHKKKSIGSDLKTIFASSNADVAYDTPLETLQAIYTFVEKEWRFDV